ncbi:MAG: HyaD/HybD family hydrogenase maturation endopeptidase [Calditrichae bacterium]|nr:HyaD/HybD family hydrogenase maturation endopeptidase [Calditrichota bacterium]MCB9056969.1 HyaD/HybD family hydrogenase maturation endopeptidase [Calditrichia bacterium]
MAGGKVKKPILVVGVGNSIQMDDGVGVHVIREMEKNILPDNVELFDGGTLGIDLLPWIEGHEYLILVDSIKADHPAGTIFRFHPQDIDYDDAPKTSIHQLGLIDSLKMCALTGIAPREVVIFAVQPGVIDWGEDLSPQVEATVPKLVRLVNEEIEKINLKISANLQEA